MKHNSIIFASLAFVLIFMVFAEKSEITAQDKVTYQEEIEQRLNELEQNIAALSAKAAHAAETGKSELKKALSDLRVKQAEARAQLERLKASGGNAWEEIKAGVNEAVQDVQSAYDRAVSRFQ
jgi:chromosome segregation ATPase